MEKLGTLERSYVKSAPVNIRPTIVNQRTICISVSKRVRVSAEVKTQVIEKLPHAAPSPFDTSMDVGADAERREGVDETGLVRTMT